MRYVEVEIKLPTHKEYKVLEFRNRDKYPAIKATLKQMARKCGWQWFRIGIGPNWSKKIY